MIRRIRVASAVVVAGAAVGLSLPGWSGAVELPPAESPTTLTVPDVSVSTVDVEGIEGLPTATTTTTTTAPEETTTTTAMTTATTTTTTVGGAGSPSTTTTTTVAKRTDRDGNRDVDDADASGEEGGDLSVVDADVVEDERRLLPAPPFVRPQAFYVPRPGLRSTTDIIHALGGVRADPGTIGPVIAPFPVAGFATYGDDWGAPRYHPSPHSHAGTDIFAARHTPVVAVTAGRIQRIGRGTAVGGNTLHLVTPDRTYYYYAHLETVAAHLRPGTPVERGEILGSVGDSGNARGTPAHLHFEIHPAGGPPIPPVPYLDAWLAAARHRLNLDARTAPPPLQHLAGAVQPQPVPDAAGPGTALVLPATLHHEPPNRTPDPAIVLPLGLIALPALIPRIRRLLAPRPAIPSTPPWWDRPHGKDRS